MQEFGKSKLCRLFFTSTLKSTLGSLHYPKSYYLPYLSVCYALSIIRRSTESEVTYALMKLNIETKQASKLWA